MDELKQLELITKIKERFPERFEAVVKAHPEWFRQIQDYKRELILTEKAKEDSPDGFFAYFEGKYGFEPQERIKRWIRKMYEAHGRNMGFTLNGYRGSRKTISFGATFLEFRIGQEPHKTNLVVTASDSTSDEIIENVTQTIEFHPFWKKVFPNVIPDKGRWSSDGYWVIDSSLSREEWTAQQSATKDPTLVGGGYTSVRINGKHPTGVLLTDDLHGINNSTSENQLKFVVRFYTTELSRTMMNDEKGNLITWAINIGVAWGQDTHQALTKSGGFLSETLPVMTRAKDGEGEYIDGVNKVTGVTYEDIVGWWHIDPQSGHTVDSIIMARGYGKRDFWQMMMMDMTAARAGAIRYYSYHFENDDYYNWWSLSGVDPSETFKEKNEISRDNSFLGIANLVKRPIGGAVLQGGELAQINPNGAVGLMRAIKSRFTNHDGFYVEDTGFGRMFMNTLSLIAPELVLIFSDLGGIRRAGEKARKSKSKTDRITEELAPFLENGTILISDEDSEFLNTVRDGLDNIMELDPHKADKRWDALDAFYHAVKSMPSVLQQVPIKDSLAEVLFKTKKPHPLAGRRK